jgi:hypothetical protein
MLAALEAADLILRIREGRKVRVVLGPTGRSDQVRQYVDELWPDRPPVEQVQELFLRILQPGPGSDDLPTPSIEGLGELERQVVELGKKITRGRATIADTYPSSEQVICHILFVGEACEGEADGGGGEIELVWIAEIDHGAIRRVRTLAGIGGSPRPTATGGETEPRTTEPALFYEDAETAVVQGRGMYTFALFDDALARREPALGEHFDDDFLQRHEVVFETSVDRLGSHRVTPMSIESFSPHPHTDRSD